MKRVEVEKGTRLVGGPERVRTDSSNPNAAAFRAIAAELANTFRRPQKHGAVVPKRVAAVSGIGGTTEQIQQAQLGENGIPSGNRSSNGYNAFLQAQRDWSG